MNILNKNYDIIVVGAGMIGSAMAIGLAKEGWRILLLEHNKLAPFNSLAPPDLRVSALSYTSVNILNQLGVWNSVLNMRAAPYRRLETWEEKNSNVIFEASNFGLPELGYVVENRILQLASFQQFSRYPNLTFLCPAKLVEIKHQNFQWEIKFNTSQKILANLIIAADGAHSQVRSLTGIGSYGWQYDQSCLLITIKTEQPHDGTIWQQFFPSGPRAFLPLFEHWACLVWYDKTAKIKQLKTMSFEQLRQQIISAFPARLGRLQVVAKDSFLLKRHHANCYVKEGLALIGDAAFTINPLAGQGVNLGYRNVHCLLRILINAKKNFLPFNSQETLLTYQQARMLNNKLMQANIDAIYTLFSSRLAGVKFSRNLALKLVQRLNKVKKKLFNYSSYL